MKTTPVGLSSIVEFCDSTLGCADFGDWDKAFNGLQMANPGSVSRIAAAVDASLTTCQMAADSGADLLLVHHGLFWSPSHPWTGRRYDLVRLLVERGLAVYSAHLPLDAHAKLGNNIQICRALGLPKPKPFFELKGRNIGFRSTTRIDREALVVSLASVLGVDPVLLPGGPQSCRQIGVVSGGAGSDLAQIAALGIDTLITGEGPHWTHALSEDLGVNVIYGGHYATETFGVKALASAVGQKFGLPWAFLDHPSGL